MPSKNSYMRKFVILQGRKTSYSDSNKTKGHVKIEVRDGKGKIAFNVEGLKHIDDADKIYRGYLVRKEQHEIIKEEVGVLDINKNGQCKVEWKVNPQSIGKSGLPLDKFQSIMVTMSSFDDRDQGLSVPLVGVIQEKSFDTEKMIMELQFTGKEAEIKEETHKHIAELKQVSIEQIEQKEEIEQIPEIEQIEEIEEIEEIREIEEIGAREEHLTQESKLIEEYQVEDQLDNDLEEEDVEDEATAIRNIVEMVSVEDKAKESKGEVRLEFGEDDNQEKITENEEINEELEVEFLEILEEKGKVREKRENQVESDDKYIKIEGQYEDYFVNKEEKQEYQEYQEYEGYQGYQEEVDWFNSDFQTPYGYSINKDYNSQNRAQIYNYQITNYTLNILKFFEKVQPFRNELRGYEFWEIEYDENNLYRGFLPYYDYVVSMYYPYPSIYRTTTCQGLIKKYKHYIFGIVIENEQPKYYIYGIQGKFKSAEHPYRGSTGFTTWLQGKNYENDKLGYWLLHIDATTGRVVSPLRTTRPR